MKLYYYTSLVTKPFSDGDVYHVRTIKAAKHGMFYITDNQVIPLSDINHLKTEPYYEMYSTSKDPQDFLCKVETDLAKKADDALKYATKLVSHLSAIREQTTHTLL